MAKKPTYEEFKRRVNESEKKSLQQQRTEEALKRITDEQAVLLGAVPAMIFWIDKEGNFIRVNEPFAAALKKSPDEINRKSLFDLYPEDQAREYHSDNLEVIESGNPKKNIEEPVQTPVGTMWVCTDKIPYRDKEGNNAGIIGFSVDITPRKRAEEALRKSESKYRTLLENLPQKIFHKDRHSVYVSCNENYARDLKIKSEEIKGKTDYEFYPKKLAEKYRADDKRIIASGKTEDIEEKYIQDGQEIWVHTSKTPLKDKKGNVTGILGIFWDITERKRAEEALRNSEEKFRSFLDNLGDVAYETDSHGIITYANKAAEKMTGMSLEDFLGKPFSPLFTEESQKVAVEVFQRTLNGESPEYELTFTNGKIGHFKDKPLRDENQKIVGAFGIARDITDLKQVEEELRKSEERFRLLSEATFEAIGIHDEGVLIEANEQLYDMFGYEPNELLGKNAIPLIVAPEFTGVVKSYIASGDLGPYEVMGLKKDGTKFPIEVRVRLMESNGRTLRISAIRDLTARRAGEKALRDSEFRYHTLFQSVPVGIGLASFDGRVLKYNNTILAITGYSGKDMEQFNVRELYSNNDERSLVLKQLQTRGSVKDYEVELKRKDGTPFYANMTIAPFILGEEECLLTVINDITEQKRAQEALQEREAALEIRTTELEETNRALRVLLKRMDDDKRELEEKVSLNIKELVVPYAEELKKSPLTPKQMTYLSILESNLNDIISPFARKLSSKYLGFTPTEIQVASLVRDGKTTKEIAELLNSSERTIESHRINIRMKTGIKNKKANLRSFLLSMQHY